MTNSSKKRSENTRIIVNSIPTGYKLTGKGSSDTPDLDSSALQDALFRTAYYHIHLDRGDDDTSILKQVCNWFVNKRLCDIAFDTVK
jgi:hypothetical protein